MKTPLHRDEHKSAVSARRQEKVIDLILRVIRVSVETVAITEAMKAARR